MSGLQACFLFFRRAEVILRLDSAFAPRRVKSCQCAVFIGIVFLFHLQRWHIPRSRTVFLALERRERGREKQMHERPGRYKSRFEYWTGYFRGVGGSLKWSDHGSSVGA
mmetsp:Transcript_53757/g.105137  ORF Transcript_53757/g.105137 Transcript_53757/m.105137 type:complete len:109 (-) Transcript_53757:326-652(-)